MSDLILVAVGDIFFSNQMSLNFKKNNHWDKLSDVLPIFQSGDIVFGNLEGPITTSNIRNQEHYSKMFDYNHNNNRTYCKSDSSINKLFNQLQFNVVSLGNNHIFDFGVKGFSETLSHLKKNQIHSFGAGPSILEARKPLILRIKTKTIAFLGYSYTYEATNKHYGCVPIWKRYIRDDLNNLKNKVDLIVLSIHFGDEFSLIPSNYQSKISKYAIDNGADVILGHHTHTPQKIEYYKNKLIVYSLGNFLFDPSVYVTKIPSVIFRQTLRSYIYKIIFSQNGEIKCEILDNNLTIKINKKIRQNYPEIKNEKTSIYQESIMKLLVLARIVILSVYKQNWNNIFLVFTRILSNVGLL